MLIFFYISVLQWKCRVHLRTQWDLMTKTAFRGGLGHMWPHCFSSLKTVENYLHYLLQLSKCHERVYIILFFPSFQCIEFLLWSVWSFLFLMLWTFLNCYYCCTWTVHVLKNYGLKIKNPTHRKGLCTYWPGRVEHCCLEQVKQRCTIHYLYIREERADQKPPLMMLLQMHVHAWC